MGNVCFVPLQGGEIVNITVPDPGAQTNWSYTIPAGYEHEIREVCCLLSTDGVVNRYAVFEILSPGGFVLWRVNFDVPITTLENARFSLYVGCSRANFSLIGLLGEHFYNDALPFVRLIPGCIIQSNFTALTLLDAFSEIRLVFHRWRT
jgi:hypothetical protein